MTAKNSDGLSHLRVEAHRQRPHPAIDPADLLSSGRSASCSRIVRLAVLDPDVRVPSLLVVGRFVALPDDEFDCPSFLTCPRSNAKPYVGSDLPGTASGFVFLRLLDGFPTSSTVT
jgi:hypothetical protein